MSIFLTWNSLSSYLFFDIVTSEEHEASVMVTEHPVETGANVTDHIRPNVDRVTIEGFISNTPVYSATMARFQIPLDVAKYTPPISLNPAAALVNGLSSAIQSVLSPSKPIVADVYGLPSGANFVADTYATLDSLRLAGTLIDIYSPSRVHTGMILESFKLARTAADGTGGTFRLELRQIVVVSTLLVDVPIPAVARAAQIAAKGNQAPQVPDSAKASVVTSLIGPLY